MGIASAAEQMPSFSQRLGYKPVEKIFQRERMDEALRVRLWNLLKLHVWNRFARARHSESENARDVERLVKHIWFNHLGWDLDAIPSMATTYSFSNGAYQSLKGYFSACKWFEAYDFLEVVSEFNSDLLGNRGRVALNDALTLENSAYRFVGKNIVEVTDKTEINAIEDGLSDAHSLVKQHLEAALRMLSDRASPDYRNSVKESISAVESACKLVTGNSKATLGDALKRIESLHPSFSKAFQALYGYTSDASGIRHALVEEPVVSYADAKFMLVTCAAFVSYLKVAAS